MILLMCVSKFRWIFCYSKRDIFFGQSCSSIVCRDKRSPNQQWPIRRSLFWPLELAVFGRRLWHQKVSRQRSKTASWDFWPACTWVARPGRRKRAALVMSSRPPRHCHRLRSEPASSREISWPWRPQSDSRPPISTFTLVSQEALLTS